MSKSRESIWTTDITPHVVRIMTMDITPDFSSPFWQKDVSGHVLVTMAMFGLVVSSFFTAVGVAAVGVNAEVAFARQAAQTAQTAAVVNAVPASAALLPTADVRAVTSTALSQPHPAMMGDNISASSTAICPQLKHTIRRGNNDADGARDVAQLQEFIANHFGLATSTIVSGHFGPITQSYLEKFQEEQGIPLAPQAGPLTRAAIARLCGQGNNNDQQNGHMGSSTPTIDSTTSAQAPDTSHSSAATSTMPVVPDPATVAAPSVPPVSPMPMPPMPPVPATTAAPVSYNDNSSNTASLIEAVSEIGDGYSRLLQASLGMFGL